MDVEKDLGDDDREMHVKLVRAREAVAEVAELRVKRVRLGGKVARVTQRGHVVIGGAWGKGSSRGFGGSCPGTG